jgi:hypothetical protein
MREVDGHYTHSELVEAAENAIALFVYYRFHQGCSEEEAARQAVDEVRDSTAPIELAGGGRS